MGFGQFRPHILSLQEQANAVRGPQRPGIGQQQGQGSQRPSGHHIMGPAGQILDPRVLYGDVQAHALCGGAEECAFLGRGFVQRHGQFRPHRRQHQAGKTGARPQIGQGAGFGRDQSCQLGRIPEVTLPQVGQGASCHQIVPGAPVDQQICIGRQPGQCFT